jgi:hypothetical protein
VFNYEVFLARTTNYLLPWLALTAQLPYEAGDVIPNIMSFFMALGSPMLLTFSLMMTIFNRRWLRSKVTRFNSRFPGSPLTARLREASSLLEVAQQVPLRMSHRSGWLASLILLDTNNPWWSRLTTRLLATRRKLTLSLITQMLVAVMAWILTIIGTFGSELGSHAEGLVLSSSTLWTWLVPLILGWITVGTQSRANDVSEVLTADTADLAPFIAGQPFISSNQEAFRVADPDSSRHLGLAGFGIHGDEIKPGPVYNYARIYTWRHTTHQLLNAFETAAHNLHHNRGLDGNPIPAGFTLAALQADPSLDTANLAAYCGLPRPSAPELTVQPTSDELDTDFGWQVIGATVTALVVQWGTTSPAIVIAYLTDVKGLGCRSGSYLLYGVFSTAAFLCCVLSVVCSRQALLRVQEPGGRGTGFGFHFYRGLSVVLTLFGRVLVLGNSFWLVVTSLFELIGFFDNCWCEGVVVFKGDKAWVVLFKNAVDLAKTARGPWASGVALSSCVMLFSYLWFCLLCRKPG